MVHWPRNLHSMILSPHTILCSVLQRITNLFFPYLPAHRNTVHYHSTNEFRWFCHPCRHHNQWSWVWYPYAFWIRHFTCFELHHDCAVYAIQEEYWEIYEDLARKKILVVCQGRFNRGWRDKDLEKKVTWGCLVWSMKIIQLCSYIFQFW